jgi:hypothetical protein
VAELTDDPAVHLVPPGDPEAFAAAVAHALAEPRMLDPSRTRFKTWAEAGDALLRILVGAKGD